MKETSLGLPIILILLLTACSGPPRTASLEAPPASLQIAVAADDFATGSPRVPFIIYDGPEQVAGVENVSVTSFELGDSTPQPGWQGTAVNYSDYEVPYWVVYPEIPRAGLWGLAAEITLADGTLTRAQFTIQVNESSQSPAVGSQPPASKNRTLADVDDISRLTSGSDPLPGLYQMTVAQALASGRPTVVTLATPAYCQTRICVPVIDSVAAVYQEYGQQANFIHLEIYKEFDPLVVADEVGQWGLSSEPWTFVLDTEGRVTARLGGPVSPRELTAALVPLLP